MLAPINWIDLCLGKSMRPQGMDRVRRLAIQLLYRQFMARQKTCCACNVKYQGFYVFGIFLVCLLPVSVFTGCRSHPVTPAQDFLSTNHTVSATKKGMVDYTKIIKTSKLDGLIAIERYGVYELSDANGDIDFIRLRIKFIGLDDVSGKEVAAEWPLLETFFSGVSTLLSTETGIETEKIELIARAGGCQIHVLAGYVNDVKCNKAPIKLTGSDNSFFIKTSIKQYNDCINSGANHTFCMNYAANSGNRSVSSGVSLLTKDKLKRFCTDALTREFVDYGFDSTCEIIHNETERYFLIKNIRTKGYITDGYWEQFAIRFSYLYGKNSGQEFIGDLKIMDGKCVARIMLLGKRPNAYEDELTQCGKEVHRKMGQAENYLAGWFNQYFSEKKGT